VAIFATFAHSDTSRGSQAAGAMAAGSSAERGVVAAIKRPAPKGLPADAADIDSLRFSWILMDLDGNWLDFEIAPDTQHSDLGPECTVKTTLIGPTGGAKYSCVNERCDSVCEIVNTPLGPQIFTTCQCGPQQAKFTPR